MTPKRIIKQVCRTLSCVRTRAAALLSIRLVRGPWRQATVLRLIPLLLAGCATATVTPAWQPTGALPRPAFVLVYDFAVTPDEIELDRGVGATLVRLNNPTMPAEEKLRVGRALARVLSAHLATELRLRGIKARRASGNNFAEETTASIKGQVLRVDEGNGTLRTVLGFGFGGTELRTHAQFFHGADGDTQLVAEADTATKTDLKPGIPSMIGVGWAAGSILGGAVAAGLTTLPSETFYATVEADAKRTAAKLAAWVAEYYSQQGWISP